ncbi:hypothetical protein HMPREF9103_01579 [Lentilactobacillus parafarraginis F0439]|uniref:Uncharacterized protein n=1 Tax=Lentilactobacillus parafarraginis F0439 TaxID=797515 RepID=G9ZPC5_9LACO|nr:hypothetical protein HMPREF9103_01579 [Lentilactobacillus parafarraginis F0439]
MSGGVSASTAYEGGTAANCRPFVLVTEGRLFYWATRLEIDALIHNTEF